MDNADEWPLEVPAVVVALAPGERRCLWRNAVGGLTFAYGSGDDRRVIKWSPASSGIDVRHEAARLIWAATFVAVPEVLECGGDDAQTWLVTKAIAAENAVSARWRAQPRTAVRAIGAGLRAFHDALPVESCPFSWSVADRLADARRRVRSERLNSAHFLEEHRHLSVADVFELVALPPPVDRLVVCQGDTCAPNTLIANDGTWRAHVDLGTLGVGDRWADLAVATCSTNWNYGPGHEGALLDAYGVAPDEERTAYYRLLWELEP